MTKNDLSNDSHGWLVIDKPRGIGSTKVVNTVKKKTGIKKIGHGGTLDPDATGILALALGEATKTVRFIGDWPKTYTFTIRLGVSTDTDDSSGKIINQSSKRPKTPIIKETLKNFQGYISQVPPKLSAIKINGERAYKLFHEGSQYQLSARHIFVQEIVVLKRKNRNEVDMKFTCGKGGYVRSLARDIGNSLGCYGHAHGIRRIACGPFNIENSIELERIKEMSSKKLFQSILPTETVLKEFPNFDCDAKDIKNILNGGSHEIRKIPEPNYSLAWIRFQNIPLAFGKVKNKIFFPSRVFNILKH